MTYDAVLLASFGGPEGPEEVMPFLERVTAGRGVPRERLELVAEHYYALGGVSPINEQSRALLRELGTALGHLGFSLPVVLGNRNSAPFFADVLASLAELGASRVLAVATSAYPSYSGCRQYRENLADAAPTGMTVEMLAPYWELDAFTARFAADIAAAVADLSTRHDPAAVRVMSTTHSLPVALAESSGPDGGAYVAAHVEVLERIGGGALVYQSRSGPPSVPWLEPDVCDQIRRVPADGATAVVLAPIGFVSDHVEVVWDLDHEAAAVAAEVGVELVRVPTPGTDSAFVTALAALVTSALREEPRTGRAAAYCGPTCCPNLRSPATPAVGPPIPG